MHNWREYVKHPIAVSQTPNGMGPGLENRGDPAVEVTPISPSGSVVLPNRRHKR